VIRFADIPVNAYAKTVDEELASYSKDDLLSIWYDMCAIREFETVLNEHQTKGVYKGVAYNHAGPPIFRSARKRPRSAWRSSSAPTITSSARIAARGDSCQGVFRDQTA